MRPRILLLMLATAALAWLAGCAPASIGTYDPGASAADVAGFWKGLWHGFIVVFSFVVSLFNDDVGVYEVRNSGHLYDLGFVLGVMMFSGGGCGGACKSKNR